MNTSDENSLEIDPSIKVSGHINGRNNRVKIGKASQASAIHITINGNNNTIEIVEPLSIKDLTIACGNHFPIYNSKILIGKKFSIEPNSKILLFQSGCTLKVGEDCMLSSNITIRLGEFPHLLFDLSSSQIITGKSELTVGNHVWIGENSYLTKSADIPDECVIGANSVVTRRFTECNSIIAGNPATIVKRKIKWLRNTGSLKHFPDLLNSFENFQSEFANFQESK